MKEQTTHYYVPVNVTEKKKLYAGGKYVYAFLSGSAASLTICVTSVFKSIPHHMFVESDNHAWNSQLKTYLPSLIWLILPHRSAWCRTLYRPAQVYKDLV